MSELVFGNFARLHYLLLRLESAALRRTNEASSLTLFIWRAVVLSYPCCSVAVTHNKLTICVRDKRQATRITPRRSPFLLRHFLVKANFGADAPEFGAAPLSNCTLTCAKRYPAAYCGIRIRVSCNKSCLELRT